AARGVPTFAVFHHFGGALEHPALADAGDVFAVPLDPKFEILVRIEALRIGSKLRHENSSLRRDLASHLLALDHHKFSGFLRGKANQDVDDAQIDVVLRRSFLVALHKIGFGRRLSLESALAEEVLHEGADVEPDLGPQGFVIRLEYHPLQSAVEALLKKKSCTPHGYVLPFRARLIIALHSASPPDHVSVDFKVTNAIDSQLIQAAVLSIVEWNGNA